MTCDEPPTSTPASGPAGSEVVTDASFSAFFAANHDAVFGALAVTVGDADLAAEATAEAMARAFQRWSSIDPTLNPAGWVYRVGLNWATSRWRRRRREVLSVDPGTHPQRLDRGGGRPEAVGDPALRAALLGLPVEQRAVVVLRFLLDWSEADTAEALGVAVGTVKSRTSRALSRLADELGEQPGEVIP